MSAVPDVQRRRDLRRMQAVALGLLLLAALVFVLTLDRGGAWGYVHAGAEASMIGAVADWFAVVALFRHPWGLPIPHTALVPTRKDELAASLQDFVAENFLSEDVVRERVAEAEPSRRVGEWLEDEQHRRRLVQEGSVIARAALDRLDDADVRDLLEQEVLPRLQAEPISPVAGGLLSEVVGEGAHHGLVDLTLDEMLRWLVENETAFSDLLRERAPWWTPQWLDDKVVDRLHLEAIRWVREIRETPDHHARLAFDGFLSQLADDLQHDADTMRRAERLKVRVLSQPQVAEAGTAVWRSLSRTISDALADPDSELRGRILDRLQAYAVTLHSDAGLRARLDAYAIDAAAFVVGRYGHELTTVITRTIEQWDGKQAADRIELHVGRDLQFIRINGTIVGGVAGVVIYSLAQLLG